MARTTTKVPHKGSREEVLNKLQDYFTSQKFRCIDYQGETVMFKEFFCLPEGYMVKVFFLKNILVVEEWHYGRGKELEVVESDPFLKFYRHINGASSKWNKHQHEKLMHFLNTLV